MTSSGIPERYEALWSGSEEAARAIVPYVLDVLSPRSVVDVGCGNGAWLSVFREHGVDDVLGLDAPYVKPSMLKIPVERFRAADLDGSFSVPRRFDLAISLEVAEHLSVERSESFVAALISLAPVVLFSAAVPGQGGQGHLNEQWPDYWADLFGRHGYRLVDGIRSRFWDRADVEPWYSQNAFFFVTEGEMARHPRLAEEAANGLRMPLQVVHPRLFTYYVSEAAALRAPAKPMIRRLFDRLRRHPR